MADTRKYVQAQKFKLSGSRITLSDTSITVDNFTLPDGTDITMTDFGTLTTATLEPGTSKEEIISFTGVTQNANDTATLTGVTRGLSFNAPYTANSLLRKSHAGGTTLVITNNPQMYDGFMNKNNDETVTGIFTFPSADASRARVDSDTDTAVNEAFVTFGQLSRQAISGASNGSTTVKGIFEQSTQAEYEAGTATGGTGANLVAPSNIGARYFAGYAADAGSNDTYVITLSPAPSAYVTGMVIHFKANTLNTGTATLNVNGLGAKTIVRSGGTTLLTGDILANQLVEVEYDGTNMVMQSAPANTVNLASGVYPAGDGTALTGIAKTNDVQLFTANGTWTKPTGAKTVVVECIGGGGSGGGGGGIATGNFALGGSGGGGGALSRKIFNATDLAASVSITVGAATTGGAGGSSTNGSNGTAGNTSSFGTLLSAFGGGRGLGGTAVSGDQTNTAGGGGGGTGGAGGTGATTSSTGGSPASTAGVAGIGGAGAGGTAIDGNSAEFGGGSGGGSNDNPGTGGGSGGSSIYGAGGGGGGSGINDANTAAAGGAGGSVNTFTIGGGGTAGATSGGAGGAGTAGDSTKCGTGGGGGGSKTSGTGGAGGAGAAPGGGGGGGGAANTVGGAGGAGARGEVRVYTYF